MAEDLKKIDENLTILVRERNKTFFDLIRVAAVEIVAVLVVSATYQHASSPEAAEMLKNALGFTAAACLIVLLPFFVGFLLAALRLKKEYERARKAAEPYLKTDTIF